MELYKWNNRTITMRYRLSYLFSFILLLAACTGENNPTSGNTLPEPQLDDLIFEPISFLQENDCSTLLSNIHSVMAEQVGPFGFGSNDRFVDGPEEEAAFDESATVTDSVADSGDTFVSETTVQESGIDEPDRVKIDQNYLYLISIDSVLSIYDHQNDYELITEIELDSFDRGFFGSYSLSLYNDQVIVFSGGWDDTTGNPATVITIYDFDGEALNKKEEVETTGMLVASRVTDGTVRAAVRYETPDLEFVFPETSSDEENSTEFNRKVILESEIEDWIPEVYNPYTEEKEIIPCENVFLPSDTESPVLTSLISINLEEEVVGASAVFGDSETAYMSETNFYVADSFFQRFEEVEDGLLRATSQFWKTNIYRFELADTGTTPKASAQVEGRLLNQFSLSEFNDVLRVVVTEEGENINDSVSSLITLDATSEETLEELGFVTGMGRGEQVFAVNLIGDVGYVVTFRQTDPLYTLDLSDPENPTIEGELKITGFSDRIYPVNEDFILGIGQEGTETGEITGFKAALFDVSDLTNPITSDTWVLDNANSIAQWDHKAFTWDPRTNLAIFPLEQWLRGGQGFVGLQGLHVDVETGSLTEEFSFEVLPLSSLGLGSDCQTPNADAEAEFVREFEEEFADGYVCDLDSVEELPDNCWAYDVDEASNINTAFVFCEEWLEGYTRSVIVNDEVVGIKSNAFDIFQLN